MAFQTQVQKQWALQPNMMRFLYADGFLPAGHTQARLVALGKKSSNGQRQAVAGATLDWDVVMSDANLFTRAGGEIALDDPQLLPAYDFIGQEIKGNHPYLTHWDGVPGQPTPEFAGTVNPQLAYDNLYPKVPLTVELVDQAMSPSALSFPMKPGTIVTPWQRPALATFDQNDFFNPAEFLDYLTQRYSFLSNTRVSDLPIQLVCSNAPFVELAFVVLQPQFARGNLKDKAGRLEEDQIMKRVSDVLSHKLRVPRANTPADVYLAALRAISGLPSLDPLTGPWSSLLKAIVDVLGTGPAIIWRATPAEDWAALGTLLFYIGAIAFGYRWGSFNKNWNNGWWQLDGTTRLKP